MSNHQKISRQFSKCAIVQAIAAYGPISRASVAKITGRSKQTVSEIVSNLEENGWVRAVGQTEGHIGRRAVVYEISPTAALVASVDLGGSKVRVAICDLTGAVLAESIELTQQSGGTGLIYQIANMVRRITVDSGHSLESLQIAVVGVPGVPDNKTGQITMAPNIAGIDQINLAESLQSELVIDVIVENDVNLAALGEHWLGECGDQENLVYLSIGTGIGAGIVVEGKLMRGAHGAAGEVGFLPFGADPFDPTSMNTGALESVTATQAIISTYQNLSGTRKNVPEVFDAASSGDKYAIETLESVAKQIARTTVSIAAIVDPSVVVIGGSIGSREELLNRIIDQAAKCFPRKIKIEKSRLGAHAALAGGASTALHQLHLSLFADGEQMAQIAVPPTGMDNFIAAVA